MAEIEASRPWVPQESVEFYEEHADLYPPILSSVASNYSSNPKALDS